MKYVKLFGIWLVCVFGSLAILIRLLTCVFTNQKKALVIAAALDRAGNASINGDPKETISSRAHRARTEGRRWGCILCKLLDRLDDNHCKKSAGF